jgi:hypothetical protein
MVRNTPPPLAAFILTSVANPLVRNAIFALVGVTPVGKIAAYPLTDEYPNTKPVEVVLPLPTCNLGPLVSVYSRFALSCNTPAVPVITTRPEVSVAPMVGKPPVVSTAAARAVSTPVPNPVRAWLAFQSEGLFS